MTALLVMIFSACFFGVQGQLDDVTDNLLASGIRECEDFAMLWVPLERETCYGGEVCLYPDEVCATMELDDIAEFQETGELPASAVCEPVPDVCQEYLEEEVVTPAPTVPTDPPERQTDPPPKPTEPPPRPTEPSPRPTEPPRQATASPQPHSSGNGMGPRPGPGPGVARPDMNPKCCQWANAGECERNPFWMRPNCQQACGTQGCDVLFAHECRVSINPNCQQQAGGRGQKPFGQQPCGPNCNLQNQNWQQPQRFGQQGQNFGQQQQNFGQQQPNFGQQRPNFGQQQPNFGQQRPNFGQQRPNFGQQRPNFGQQRPNFGQQRPNFGQPQQNFGQQQQPTGAANCVDSPQYANQCLGWRNTCQSNPYFMKVQCQRTCGTCGITVGNVNPKPSRPGCIDSHQLCGFWANELGECWKNPSWMGRNCRLSCNKC